MHYYIYIATPSTWAGCDKDNFLREILTGLNLEYSFSQTGCHTNVQEPSLTYDLSIAGRIVGCTSFPRIFVLCGIQTVTSRIWARVAVSVSLDDNHYTKSTSNLHMFIHTYTHSLWITTKPYWIFPIGSKIFLYHYQLWFFCCFCLFVSSLIVSKNLWLMICLKVCINLNILLKFSLCLYVTITLQQKKWHIIENILLG